MAAFQVEEVYWHPTQDLLLLAGRLEGSWPSTDIQVDLPQELGGPGWVPVLTVQVVDFKDKRRTCLILHDSVIAGKPLFEPDLLKGKPVDLRVARSR